MRKRFSLKLVILCMFLSLMPVTAFASEIPEGYTVVNGDENGTLADAFRETKEQNNKNINTEVMAEADKKISTFAGTLTSCIIYLIFALTGFTTACDLLYIGIPAIRPYLYDGGFGKDLTGQANANLIGRNMGWTANANDNYARAGMHGANAQGYAQRAQQRAMMGDVQGARHDMRMANMEQQSANHAQQWGDRFMQGQAQSDAWRAEHNQNAIQNAQRRANNNAR